MGQFGTRIGICQEINSTKQFYFHSPHFLAVDEHGDAVSTRMVSSRREISKRMAKPKGVSLIRPNDFAANLKYPGVNTTA